MTIREVAEYFDRLLKKDAFGPDPSNNGLQVAGDDQRECRKAAFAVDACMATFEKAAAADADLLIVHHGLSWGGEPRRWTGMTGRRFHYLFGNSLALYAMHLPLDAHGEYGNNANLARLLNLRDRRMFFPYHGMEIGILGSLDTPLTADAAAEQAANGREYRLFCSPVGPKNVHTVAVISGGGGLDGLDCAIAAGAELLVTGDFDHTMYHVVRESPIHVAALGHYNSEVYGVRSLQELAANNLKLETVWIDSPTGL